MVGNRKQLKIVLCSYRIIKLRNMNQVEITEMIKTEPVNIKQRHILKHNVSL